MELLAAESVAVVKTVLVVACLVASWLQYSEVSGVQPDLTVAAEHPAVAAERLAVAAVRIGKIDYLLVVKHFAAEPSHHTQHAFLPQRFAAAFDDFARPSPWRFDQHSESAEPEHRELLAKELAAEALDLVEFADLRHRLAAFADFDLPFSLLLFFLTLT